MGESSFFKFFESGMWRDNFLLEKNMCYKNLMTFHKYYICLLHKFSLTKKKTRTFFKILENTAPFKYKFEKNNILKYTCLVELLRIKMTFFLNVFEQKSQNNFHITIKLNPFFESFFLHPFFAQKSFFQKSQNLFIFLFWFWKTRAFFELKLKTVGAEKHPFI